MQKYYPTHYFIYGPPGTYKTSLVSTFPKPMLVIFMDAFGKDIPYLRRGQATDYYVTEQGVMHKDVRSSKDKLLIRIAYFHDNDPDHPAAFDAVAGYFSDIDMSEFRTLVVDSFTSWEYLARLKADAMKHDESDNWFVPRKTKEFLERYLRSVFCSVRENLVVIGHVTKERVNDKAGKNDSLISLLYSPSAPGKMKEDIPSIFPEVYTTKVIKAEGKKRVVLQTQIDNRYVACTQIAAPDLMEMTPESNYKDLWINVED